MLRRRLASIAIGYGEHIERIDPLMILLEPRKTCRDQPFETVSIAQIRVINVDCH